MNCLVPFLSNIPIYLVVTKTDKIAGFTEYFSSLSEEEKDEVLGVTFGDTVESIRYICYSART